MKITNTGTKIVNIAGRAIMPGDTAEVGDGYENNASLTRLAKMGFVSLGNAKAEKKSSSKKTSSASSDSGGGKNSSGESVEDTGKEAGGSAESENK